MLLDTFAWVEYFDGSAAGRKVAGLLDDADIVYTCPIVLAELYSKACRLHGEEAAKEHVDAVLERCAVIEHTADLAVEAGRIHARMKRTAPGFGMADAFVLAAARSRGMKVLTGDSHFRGLDDAINV